MKKATISFHTIGCRLNQYETAVLRNSFSAANFKIVPIEKPADITVINTCTVTEHSDTDTRRFVNRLIRLNPRVKIALVGCQAQLQADTLKKFPNVRWVIGNAEKFDLSAIVADESITKPYVNVKPIRHQESFQMKTYGIDTEHTRANLKIQDGCDNFCTYCEVPYARGRARSRDFNDIIKEATILADAGHKEIILTGINIGAYQHQQKTLLDVIKALEKIQKLKRIRISSIEPTKVLEELVAYMRQKTKLCRYLHVPFQHGHNDILKLMKRKYDVCQLNAIIAQAFETVPNICIGTDVIVGFPGETDTHFEETYNLLKILPVSYFHVFSFSKRNNAKAKEFPRQVNEAIIQQRSAKLRALSQRKRRLFYERMLGKTVSVLFEQHKRGFWYGLTDNFISVKISSNKNLKNVIRRVQLLSIDGQAVTGVI
jgi:threonylcarbamoyladenosine tRNA methylthiotransferase MtaB